MKAAVIDSYGDVSSLQVREIDVPSPDQGEVLIRVHASSINPLDWKIRKGTLRWVWPVKFPFVLGFEVAGVVEQVGQDVQTWKPGDHVFATFMSGGGHAEFVKVDQKSVAAKPPSLTFEQAAVCPVGGLSALQSLRDLAKMQAGDRVLINGATGGVGHFAVQIAKIWGGHVTAVASTRNLELARSLGADEVIDYTARETLQGEAYDVIFDVVPNLSFVASRRHLTKRGTYVTSLPDPVPLLWELGTRLVRGIGYGKQCRTLMLRPKGEDLEELSKLITTHSLQVLVEHTFPLEAIQDATRQIETGHTRGKIAISMPNG